MERADSAKFRYLPQNRLRQSLIIQIMTLSQTTSSGNAATSIFTPNSLKANSTILVTGGAGYIGSHTTLELLELGHRVVVVDNYSNSSPEALKRVASLVGKVKSQNLTSYKADLCDMQQLRNVFEQCRVKPDEPVFDVVIHFASLKSVTESVAMPLHYYHNNLTSTIQLVKVMEEYGCHQLIFSSTAAVYGTAPSPLTEKSQVGIGITNAYGRSKLMIENILEDLCASPDGRQKWTVVILRYFNPVGAHCSGRIGEDPNGIPNNLMPYITQVAVGRRPQLTIYGNDYNTVDGTGVRDFIHVVDLAKGHVAALKCCKLRNVGKTEGGLHVFNLGSGTAYSVLQLVNAMEKVAGVPISYTVGPRRPGDIDQVYALPNLAKDKLGWQTERGIDEICQDQWRWQSQNRNGYCV